MTLIPVGLDLGSSQTKSVTISRRNCFASAITTQKANAWNGEISNVTVGDEAIKASKRYNADTFFPVSLGRPVDEDGYLKLAKHALSNLGLTHNVGSVYLVVGLPYETADRRVELKNLFEKELKVNTCRVETQSRGTLRTLGLSTGIVINIGFGTTEAVIFDDGSVVGGDSLHVAVQTILDGLNADGIKIEKTSLTDVSMYTKYERESKVHAVTISDTIHRWYKEKMISAKHDYPVVISGGGIKNDAIRKALEKSGIEFKIPDDPLYSNARGHFMRAEKNC